MTSRNQTEGISLIHLCSVWSWETAKENIMTTNGTTVQEDRTMQAIQDMAQIMERQADLLARIASELTALTVILAEKKGESK